MFFGMTNEHYNFSAYHLAIFQRHSCVYRAPPAFWVSPLSLQDEDMVAESTAVHVQDMMKRPLQEQQGVSASLLPVPAQAVRTCSRVSTKKEARQECKAVEGKLIPIMHGQKSTVVTLDNRAATPGLKRDQEFVRALQSAFCEHHSYIVT